MDEDLAKTNKGIGEPREPSLEVDKPQVAIDVTPEPSSGGRGSSSLRQRLEDYCRRCLLGDVVAGVTVGSVLVPQSMAYALLAGLPPEMGLYSSLMPLISYSIFGSSPHLAVGPVSVVCVLIAVQMSELNVPATSSPRRPCCSRCSRASCSA